MIDVLKRLSELDSNNPNVKTTPMVDVKTLNKEMVNSPSLPPLNDMSDLRALAGLKESKIEECGMMPMQGATGPASLNVSAGSAEELSHMLQDIMSLAGVAQQAQPHDHGHDDSMRRMLDTMNEPQSEEILGALGGGALGGIAGLATGGPAGAALGALSGAAAGDSLTDPDADEVESYTNTPSDPTRVPKMDSDHMAHNPNQGDHRERQAGLARARPEGTMEERLFAEYQRFITESKKKEGKVKEDPNEGNAYGQAVQNTPKGKEIKINGKGTGDIKREGVEDECNHTPKGEKCPVHGLKECGTMEGAMSDLDADRKDRQYKSRQAKTTMKHIKNPTPGEKAAAQDIKPGIAGYKDRYDMLKSAERDGRLKSESTGDYSAKKARAGKDIGKPELRQQERNMVVRKEAKK